VQRPEAGERSPLDTALEIDGAYAVALIAAGDRTLTWWAGGRMPGDADVAAALGLARAATAMVQLADPEDEVGDVLVTTAAAFHVLRLVRPADQGDLVAHLMLRRGAANLAMARHEFKVLIERYAKGSTPAAVKSAGPEPAPRSGTRPVPPPPAIVPAARAGQAAAAGQLPLPRRPRSTGNHRPAPAQTGPMPPGWFTMAGQPYVTDDTVLDRILSTLKQL
jgi:hypothetical protein